MNNRMSLFGMIYLVLSLLASASVSAGTYYVSPDGLASNPGTQVEPWSLTKANSVMLPGDTAILLDGSYLSRIHPANSGTAEAPITYRAANKHQAKFDLLGGSDSLANQNYIVISGIRSFGGSLRTARGSTLVLEETDWMDATLYVDGTDVEVRGGIMLDKGNIRLIDWSSTMIFPGNQTLGGRGTVVFDQDDYSRSRITAGAGGVLTIGNGIEISSYARFNNFGSPDSSFVNYGTIKGGTRAMISVEGQDWINKGLLVGSSSGGLQLHGTFTTAGLGRFKVYHNGEIQIMGVLDNRGDTLFITEETGNLDINSGTIVGGTISTPETGPAFRCSTKTSLAPSTLDGVTLAGHLEMIGPGRILNNLMMDGGSVDFGGFDRDVLLVPGDQTFGGTGRIFFSGNGAIEPIDGTLTFDPGITLTTPFWGGYATLGGDTGRIINKGTVYIERDKRFVTFVGLGLTNYGTFHPVDGGEIHVKTTDPFDNMGTLQIGAASRIFVLGQFNQIGSEAVLSVELSDDSCGVLKATQEATLEGTLSVSLSPGFKPVPGDSFVIIEGSSVQLSLKDVILPPPPLGVAFEMDYSDPSAVVVRAIGVPIPPAEILGRHVFYNNSSWDGDDLALNVADDMAIATDKVPLLPRQTATFANYTSYSRGINGLMIDIRYLISKPMSWDFEFRVGNSGDPSQWPLVTILPYIIVRPGEGIDGSDRVVFRWPDGSIQNQWLKVTIKPSSRTNLPMDDVFYFGNAVGETGNSTIDAKVSPTDVIAVRNNPHTLSNDPAAVDDAYDFDRDRNVGQTDEIICKNNGNSAPTALKLITAP